MNGRLLRQTWSWQRVRWLIVMVAGFGWGMLIPLFYAVFSDAFREMADSGFLPEELMNFGSGSLFTLDGAITLGFQHPLALAMIGIFAIGATSTAIAGERQRGTLEVLISRPISRRTVYTSIAVALFVVVTFVFTAILAGMATSAAMQQVLDEIDAGLLPLVLANGLLLWAAFVAFGMAASVSFDRAGPAIGLTLAYLLVNYFLEILGSLWTDVAWSQEYSLFHHFQPGEILTGSFDPIDLLILGAATIIPVIYALVVFPRRDLAAPS